MLDRWSSYTGTIKWELTWAAQCQWSKMSDSLLQVVV